MVSISLIHTANHLQLATGFGLSSFLKNVLLDTPSLGKSDLKARRPRSNYEDVGKTSGEGVSLRVSDGDNVKRSLVTLNMLESTHASCIAPFREHNRGTKFKLDNIRHLASGNINLNNIIDLYIRVRVPEGASVMRDSSRDGLGSGVHLINAA